MKAFKMAAAWLGCTLQINKESRCLNVGALLADALSKVDFWKFRGWGGRP